MEQVLTIRELSHTFSTNGGLQKTPIFEGLSFHVDKGEIVCIVGQSGCGKSTLLNIISGLLEPLCGTVSFPFRAARGNANIGYIFQYDALLPWRTVWGNIVLPLELNGGIHDSAFEEADRYMRNFNLDSSIKTKYPDMLSGGMRQRVAIIQALMHDPELFLLDEPFSALDFYTKLKLEDEFRRLIKTENKSAIFVTHDIDEAIALADRILIMGRYPDGIVCEVPVHFEGNRNPEIVRGLPEFGQLFSTVWNELRNRTESNET